MNLSSCARTISRTMLSLVHCLRIWCIRLRDKETSISVTKKEGFYTQHAQHHQLYKSPHFGHMWLIMPPMPSVTFEETKMWNLNLKIQTQLIIF